MTKTDLNYPAFSVGFVDFAVQFYFHCKQREAKFDSGVIFLDQSQSFATHSNQWDCFICIDHRCRQMAFFMFVKMGKAPLSRTSREIKQLLSVYACKV